MLELQQQLAVAVTADRKKDIMIEQLDKVPGSLLGAGRQRIVNRGWPTTISLFTLGVRVQGGFIDYWEKVAVDPAPRGRKRAKQLF